MAMSKETEQQLAQLQMLEQNVQQLAAQRQQFQSQLAEVESALEELAKTEKSYKIVGNLMVLSKKEDLKKELDSKKEMLEVRIKSVDKQEKSIKEKSEELRNTVMKELGQGGSDGKQ